MKKVFISAAVAVMLVLGVGAGVVVASVTANPSSDVLYDPDLGTFSTPPGDYAEGVTIQEFDISFGTTCKGEGIATTTRLGDEVVQEIVLTRSFDTSSSAIGDHCTRAGSASGFWTSDWENNSD